MDRSPQAQPSPSPKHVLVLTAAVGAIAFLFACQQLYDLDAWWHLATGRWILQEGRFPTVDPFSFTTKGAPWVPHSLIPDLLMALVHRQAGIQGLVLAKALLVAAAFVLAFRLAVRAGAQPWLAALALVAAVPIARFQFRERPQILMFALVPLFYWLLSIPGAEKRRRTWIVLAVAMLGWVNVHGSFFMAIGLAGALFVERAAAWLASKARRDPSSGDLRSVLLAGGLVLLLASLAVVNPFGLALPRQMLADFTGATVTRSIAIEEFQPLVPSAHPGFVAMALLTGLSFAAAGRRARVYPAIAFVAFNWLAFTSVRFVAIAALVDACVLTGNVRERLARLGEWLTSSGRPFGPRHQASLLGPLLLLGTLGAFLGTFSEGREARFGLGVNEGRFPGPSVRYLAAAGFSGNLFNSWDFGGYLLFNLPAARTLIDGRCLPAQFALLDRLAAMDVPALDDWLARNGVKGALLTRSDRYLPLFSGSPRWVQTFFDDRAVVYLRKDVADSLGGGATARHRFIRPEVYDPSYLLPIARGAQAAEAEAELRGAVAEAPSSFMPRFLLGYFLEAQGKPEALDHYLAAARLSPGLAFAHNDLGTRAGAVALATGRIGQVEPFLREALAMKKGDSVLEALIAMSLYAQQKLPEAEAGFRRALAASPDLVLALTNLGYVYVDTRRPAQAIPLFERARKVAPADENAAYGLALALQAAGNRTAAAAAWRSFLSSFPASAWASKARQRLAECGGP